MAPQHPLIDRPAPSFSIPDSNGELFQFPPEKEGRPIRKPIALFFYPESGTYGCTREACHFRDALVENDIYKRSDVLVVGISSDPVEKQNAFVAKHKLSYPVLSDTDHAAHKAYKIGRGMLGLSDARITFVIDRNGIVKGVLNASLSFSGHAKFVAKELEKMQDSDATEARVGQESGTPSLNPSEAEERGELARAAQAVCG
ncbi:thioredoxin-like protein [Boletus reticuloceps]|uniref:thioredoxin-dependent peroxiredoxin n=1 Tax=Boletus reticuloceps TaxID=495285 RepID=A0A8I2YQ72_9AGAM|nr:thioredoxin-like protein [Boletus reticuloceps]